MPIHDTNASAVNLAKAVLQGLDSSKLETAVQTETLRLLLETLIALGSPPQAHKLSDAAARTVAGHVVGMAGLSEKPIV